MERRAARVRWGGDIREHRQHNACAPPVIFPDTPHSRSPEDANMSMHHINESDWPESAQDGLSWNASPPACSDLVRFGQIWSSDRSPSAAAIISASAVLSPVGRVVSGIADVSTDDDAPLALRARASAP